MRTPRPSDLGYKISHLFQIKRLSSGSQICQSCEKHEKEPGNKVVKNCVSFFIALVKERPCFSLAFTFVVRMGKVLGQGFVSPWTQKVAKLFQ